MRRLVALLLLLALPVLAACDDDDDEGVIVDDDVETTLPVTEPDQETTTTAAEPATTTTAAAGGATPPTLEGQVNDRGTEQLQGDSLAMDAGDFFFDPTFVQTAPGASFTVTVTNVGDVPHTFTIEDMNIDEVLDPGQEAQVRVDLPDDGPVEFICRFHVAQGMKGAFFFQ